MLKRKIEQSETSIVKLQAHTEKFTYPRDLRYVAKANIIPDEEFKTEIYSIKREAERKFIGSLTKLIIAALNATVNSEVAKSEI